MVIIDRVYAGGAVQAVVQGTMTPTVPGAGGTFTVDDDTGWPVTGKFTVKLNRGLSDEEHLVITSRSGTTFTVDSRGADGTNAQAHDHPTCEIYFDARSANLIVDHVDDVEADPHATKLLNNARHDVTARHTYGAALGTRPTPASTGTANAAGSGSNPSAGDHVHAIGAGSINSSGMFAAGVVDAAAIATDAVGTAEIATDAVTSAEIAPDAVGTSEIAADAVGASEIAAGAVGTSELAAGVYGASAQTVGDANAAGAAATMSRSDHVHASKWLGHLAAPVRRALDQTGLGSGMTDFTGLSITGTVGTGRRIRIRGHAYIEGQTSGANYSGVIREGGVTIGKFGWFRAAAAFESAVLEGSATIDAPSSGAHTYKLSMESSGGSTFNLLGATDTAWIELLDEGPI